MKSQRKVAKKLGISKTTVKKKMQKLGVDTVTDDVIKECKKVVAKKKKIAKLISKDKDIVTKENKKDNKEIIQIKSIERLNKAKRRYKELSEIYNNLLQMQKNEPYFTDNNNGTMQSPYLDKIAKYAQLLNQTDETISRLEERLGIAAESEENKDPRQVPEKFLTV